MPSRPLVRRALLTASAVAALTMAASASAWSWSWGDGEAVKGDGKTLRETRAVSGFDGVRVAGSFDVRLRQGNAAKAELEGDGNLLAYVETRVVDGAKGKSLEIGVRKGYNLQSRQPIRIDVEMPSLRAVAVAGSGKVAVDSFKSGELTFSVAGSGDVVAPQINADKLTLSIAGSGDIAAGGRATEVHVSIAGSGDVKAADLAGDEVKVSIAGSGNAAVQAAKRLKVSIAGSGDVSYSGAAEVSSSVSGSGSVKKR